MEIVVISFMGQRVPPNTPKFLGLHREIFRRMRAKIRCERGGRWGGHERWRLLASGKCFQLMNWVNSRRKIVLIRKNLKFLKFKVKGKMSRKKKSLN